MINLKNTEYKNLYLIILFSIFFTVGIMSFKDYGVSSDALNSTLKGMVTANYLGQKILPSYTESYKKRFSKSTNKEYKKIQSLSEGKTKYYGVVFEFPTFLIERIFNVSEKHKQYQFKHFLTFLLFFVSLISFYKLINLRFQNWILAIIGVTIMFLSPRIFANSFYNNKDIVFLSFFIFSIHSSIKFLQTPNLKTLIFSALFCALAIDVRIMAIITPVILFITIFIKQIFYKKNIKIFLTQMIQYFFFLIFFVIIFWPYLWSSPINNFIEAYNVMSKYPMVIHNFFLGEYILSSEVPKNYLLVWILVTTPPLYILLFVSGVSLFIFNIIIKISKKVEQTFFIDMFCLLILITVFYTIGYIGANLYNGWRQVYFLYALFVYFSVFGLYEIYQLFNERFKKYLICTLILLFSFNIYWIKSNHPHQYVYFNFLAGKHFNKKFEMDYWGLSYKENFEFMIKNENTELFKIFNLSQNKMYIHSIILPENVRKKFKFVDNPLDAEYLITNYYYDKKAKYDFLEKDFIIINDIKVEGVSINTLYKKIVK